jgi:hypothetical protein
MLLKYLLQPVYEGREIPHGWMWLTMHFSLNYDVIMHIQPIKKATKNPKKPTHYYKLA